MGGANHNDQSRQSAQSLARRRATRAWLLLFRRFRVMSTKVSCMTLVLLVAVGCHCRRLIACHVYMALFGSNHTRDPKM